MGSTMTFSSEMHLSRGKNMNVRSSLPHSCHLRQLCGKHENNILNRGCLNPSPVPNLDPSFPSRFRNSPISIQDTERTIESTLEVFRKSDVAAATSAAAGPLAAAAAAAKNAGFDVDGGRRSGRQVTGGGTVTAGGAPGRGVAAVSGGGAQDDEARTIVLERCGALARSYGAKKQAIAVDNLLSSMVKAGVQMNARFLNNALVRSATGPGRGRGGEVAQG